MGPEIFVLAIFCLTVIALAVIGTRGEGQEEKGGKTADKALDALKTVTLVVLKWFFRNP